MELLPRRKPGKYGRGQIGVLFIMSVIILIIFVGLSIGLGMASVTKTTLGKAVDTATLLAKKSVSQGTADTCNTTSVAGQAGAAAFKINFNSVPNLTATTTTPNVCFSLDANNNTLVTVTATATLNTYFIRILGAAYNTLSVSRVGHGSTQPDGYVAMLDEFRTR